MIRTLIALAVAGAALALYGVWLLIDRTGVEYEPTPARVLSTSFTEGYYATQRYADGKNTHTAVMFNPPEWHATVLSPRGEPVRCRIGEADFIRLREGDTVTARLITGRLSGDVSCLRALQKDPRP